MDAPYERLMQMLSAMLIQINALHTLLEDELPDVQTMRDGLNTVEQMTREALYIIRANHNEELPELTGVTLAEALSRLVDTTAEQLNLSSRVSLSGADEQGRPKEHTLSSHIERILFLVARETLYDVQYHKGARKLRLTLNYGQDNVQMSIEDDGAGPAQLNSEAQQANRAAPPFISDETLADNALQSSLSVLHELRSRLTELGGSLEQEATGEHGTRVTAHVPYLQHMHTSEHAATSANDNHTPDEDRTSRRAIAQPLPMVRVLVVDGQAVTRAGLRRLLESYGDLQIVGEAADGVQAVSETLELGPQVVLLDSHLPNNQSIEALRQIKLLQLETRVLLLSAQDREEYLYETLRAGADGYVLKDIAPDELAQSIRAVARGELLVQPQLAGRLLSRFGRQGRGSYESLTAREREVLALLARGLRNKEIASRLYVSERTVNFHLANIYQKLNVSGRTEALSKALEQGLITA